MGLCCGILWLHGRSCHRTFTPNVKFLLELNTGLNFFFWDHHARRGLRTIVDKEPVRFLSDVNGCHPVFTRLCPCVGGCIQSTTKLLLSLCSVESTLPVFLQLPVEQNRGHWMSSTKPGEVFERKCESWTILSSCAWNLYHQQGIKLGGHDLKVSWFSSLQHISEI